MYGESGSEASVAAFQARYFLVSYPDKGLVAVKLVWLHSRPDIF